MFAERYKIIFPALSETDGSDKYGREYRSLPQVKLFYRT